MTQAEAEPIEAIQAGEGAPDFLVHNEGDHVAVSVQDVDPGMRRAIYMDSDREVEVEVVERIPLGHKVALTDLPKGAALIEYGVRVAIARQAIGAGCLAHIHNLRSARWERSL